MKASIQSLVAFAACFVLVLPPGTCGMFASPARANNATGNRSCCHKSAPVQHCQPGQAPKAPTLKCCCTHDDALPQKSVQPPPVTGFTFLLAADFHVGFPAMTLVLENRIVTLPTEPLLHVLLCVWRC